MNIEEWVKILRENRFMRTREEYESFQNALDIVGNRKDNIEFVEGLYLVFEDDTEVYNVMRGLLHLLEKLDPNNQHLVNCLSQMMPHAKDWIQTFMFRILNTPVARNSLKRNYQSTDKKTQKLIEQILKEIEESDPEFEDSINYVLN